MKKIIVVSLFLVSYMGLSQNSGIGINATGVNPDPSAGLDVDFNDKGFLMPRLTTAQRDGVQNPAVGLQIYNTTINCLQVYMPLNGWRNTVCDCQMPSSASAFTFTDSLANNTDVVFNAITPGLNYSWTFQNGTPSTSNQPTDTVTWANPGIYGVTLTVTDNVGCSASTTDSITVLACPPPLALNFTNCNKIGRNGPSQNECNNAYIGTPLTNNVTVTSGIQEWTVPATGNYYIEVYGAGAPAQVYQSPYNYTSNGAIIKGNVALTVGQKLQILVGQQPSQSDFNGGAGGTFVAIGNSYQSATPLIIAGGGGSYRCGYDYSGYQVIIDGSTSNNGNSSNQPGGANGNGGGCNSGDGGGAGAGFYGDGCGAGTKAYSFVNGGIGGVYSPYGDQEGGFGGGGQGGWGGSGGGGGYSGGGGGNNNPFPPAGGGGSYIDVNATNVSTSDGQYNNSSTFNGGAITNLNSYNSGHGYVNITLVCP